MLGFVGCLLLALVVLVGVVTALATLVAAALLGVLAPGAAPSAVTAVAIGIVIVLAIAVLARVFAGAVRPIADLADASDRLADGEPGVRVAPRGPGPVRRLAVAFNAMAERLDRSRDDRRALLADITHELRTPLTVITGGLEAMLDGVHPADEDHLAPVLAESRVMDRLLEDLRTLSLTDAGALALYREPTDLRALESEVAGAHRPMAEAAGVVLTATDGQAVVTSVDPLRVREILANLVVNAIHHTPPGGRVTLDVAADANEATLTVTDTGQGIPATDLDRVFDRFQRRSDSGGSGLGLAIVRGLATAHGGSVEARSEGIPGRGSIFLVHLPRRD